MQKLYDFRMVTSKDYPSLKNMWCEVFGDPAEVVDNFFDRTAKPDNIVAAFCGDEPVSALYLLDSIICVGGKPYKAYYVYAVSTLPEHRGKGLMKQCLDRAYEKAIRDNASYLYLVPAEKSLFDLYGKAGYKTGFYNISCELNKNDYPKGAHTSCALTFDEYIKYRQCTDGALATLGEKAFDSFYNPVGSDVRVVHVADVGYAVAESCDGKCIVHELFGNAEVVLGCVFDAMQCDTLTYKAAAQSDGSPYGMYMALNGAPDLVNGFFGIPYGG